MHTVSLSLSFSLPRPHSIDLTVKPGELIAVVGQVGAGKSSLISALLGEMEKTNGHVALRVWDTELFSNNYTNNVSFSLCD